MVLAVAVVLAVGVVVFLVVGHQIRQGEAVVAGDEVDACGRAASGGLIEIRGSGQAGGELAQRCRLAAPVVADGIAVLAVPLRPQPRKIAHLVAALADIPGLGDQLDLADHRVLLDDVEERREPVDVVELPRERGGQVEPETIDVHLQHPVAQRVHDQLQGVRMPRVETVTGSGEILVEPQIAVEQTVVGGVVDTTEVDRRPEMVALGGVVVDDVENHLDARIMERPDHILELGHRAGRRLVCRVLILRGEESESVVAPIVSQPQREQTLIVHELVDRHQFDRGDIQRLEMLDHRRVCEAGVGTA